MLSDLVDAGVNVLRLNFSHGKHSEHEEIIKRIHEVRAQKQRPLAIMLDTKGPEIRTGDMEPIHVALGQTIRLVAKKERPGDVEIHPAFILDEVEKGMDILFDDGYVDGYITCTGKGFVEVEIRNEGWIKKYKGINIPGGKFSLPFMTDKDIEDIEFGVKMGVEMIAASFIMSVEHVMAIKDLLKRLGRPDILLIAKIESRMGIESFDKILQVSDGIMVARGDLGVELPIASIPGLQKMMIRKCNEHAKIVIVATQMLESMIQNPRPTRAEATDVANSVHDGATAVMLSGETAVGKYPLQVVKMMDRIIVEAEKDFGYEEYFHSRQFLSYHDVPSGVALAAVNTSYSLGASAIFVCSKGGDTARRVCRYRPRPLVIVITPSEVTYHQTAVTWGAVSIIEKEQNIEKEFFSIACYALQKSWLKFGDLAVLTSGKPYGKSFTTNTIMVESVGNVILYGESSDTSQKERIGKVVFLLETEPGDPAFYQDKIVIIDQCRSEYFPVLMKAKAIILQNSPHDEASIEKLKKFSEEGGPPFVFHADGAFSLLMPDTEVRIDFKRGLVLGANSPTEETMLRQKLPY